MYRWFVLLLAGPLLLGCNAEPPAATRTDQGGASTSTPPAAVGTAPARTAASGSEPVYHLDHAQPRLPTVRLFLGTRELTAELCLNLTQVATGLMFRESIGADEGMLFIFRRTQQRAFYMKNVKFPIAVAYIDPEGVIREIVQLKAQDPEPVPSKSSEIQFVLETAPDWFERNGVGVGTLVLSDKGPLRQAFAPRAQLP